MQLWILPLTYDSKVSFLIQIPKWSMPCILKHACPSHQKNEATRSSLEDKPLWSMKLCPCLGGYPLTLLTTSSIVPCLSFDWWSSVLVWWCLVLWPCLIRSLSWLLVYCGSSTYNDIICLVGFFCCTSHLLEILLFLYLIEWRTPKEEFEVITGVNKQMLLPSSPSRSKQVEGKKTLL